MKQTNLFSSDFKEDESSKKYSSKVESPIYEPKNKKPHVLELCNKEKTNRLIREIKNSFDELIEKTDEPGNYFSINLINSISSGQYTKPSNINSTFVAIRITA
jgi:hypothetical protein